MGRLFKRLGIVLTLALVIGSMAPVGTVTQSQAFTGDRYWYNHLKEAKKNNIPIININKSGVTEKIVKTVHNKFMSDGKKEISKVGKWKYKKIWNKYFKHEQPYMFLILNKSRKKAQQQLEKLSDALATYNKNGVGLWFWRYSGIDGTSSSSELKYDWYDSGKKNKNYRYYYIGDTDIYYLANIFMDRWKKYEYQQNYGDLSEAGKQARIEDLKAILAEEASGGTPDALSNYTKGTDEYEYGLMRLQNELEELETGEPINYGKLPMYERISRVSRFFKGDECMGEQDYNPEVFAMRYEGGTNESGYDCWAPSEYWQLRKGWRHTYTALYKNLEAYYLYMMCHNQAQGVCDNFAVAEEALFKGLGARITDKCGISDMNHTICRFNFQYKGRKIWVFFDYKGWDLSFDSKGELEKDQLFCLGSDTIKSNIEDYHTIEYY